MSRDPFDYMHRSNPVPPEQTPSAPLGEADRIVGYRAPVPGWFVAVAAAAVVVVVGGGTLLLVNGDGSKVVGAATTSSTPVASTTGTTPTSTTIVHPTTTLGSGDIFTAVVYLFADGVENTAGSGPYLIPVERGVADNDVAAGTMLALLEGAPSDTPALTTAIPEGVVLRDATIDGMVATIDLSEEFVGPLGEGYSNESAFRWRLAQVTFTLTGLDGVESVRFRVDGTSLSESGSPIIGGSDFSRADFEDLLPAILIETPAYGGATASPLVATGTANVFEASVSVALTDGDGLILWEGFTTATCGTGCRGEWSVEIPFEVDVPQLGSLVVWEESARDGGQTNIREHTVWLLPDEFVVSTTTTSIADSFSSCSGSLVNDDLVEQPELPVVVAVTRAAIFDAALACDWSQLERLVDHEPLPTFGEVGPNSISGWQESEGRGEEPMRFLAELLNRPPSEMTVEEKTFYSWPSAFGPDWSEVPEAHRQALRPLYGDDDFAVFDDFGGYIGYRVGITEDGTWVFFVAGD